MREEAQRETGYVPKFTPAKRAFGFAFVALFAVGFLLYLYGRGSRQDAYTYLGVGIVLGLGMIAVLWNKYLQWRNPQYRAFTEVRSRILAPARARETSARWIRAGLALAVFVVLIAFSAARHSSTYAHTPRVGGVTSQP